MQTIIYGSMVISTTSKPSRISVVVPLYNEEATVKGVLTCLQELERELIAEDPSIKDLEIVFVDDRSKDKSFEIASNLALQHKNVKVVKLAFNSGSHAAIMAGITNCSGDAITFIAGDLQDPPQVLKELINEWRQGTKIVWASRSDQLGFKRPLFSKLYWYLCAKLNQSSIPEEGVDFFLIDKQVKDTLAQRPHRQAPIFLAVAETRYNSTTIKYEKQERERGKSGWTMRKKIALFLDSVVLSKRLTQMFATAGMCGLPLAFVLFGASICLFFLNHLNEAMFLTVVAISFLCLGIQSAIFWLFAETMHRAGLERRESPNYIVERIITNQDITDFTSAATYDTSSSVIEGKIGKNTTVSESLSV